MTKKDKTQLMVLGGIILVVLVVVVYNYRDRFLPKPVGGAEQFAAPKRLEAPVQLKTEVLKRADYQDLKSYGTMDINPNPSESTDSSGGGTAAGGATAPAGATDDIGVTAPSF